MNSLGIYEVKDSLWRVSTFYLNYVNLTVMFLVLTNITKKVYLDEKNSQHFKQLA